jgi:hypothetical protein
MRFVAVKTEAQQARATTFRARDLLVRQRTQLSNALRGHLAEYGIVAAQGMVQLKRLQEALETLPDLPSAVREIGRMYLDQIAVCSEKIATLERALRLEAARGEVTARLQTMPGVGPITALAVEAFAPPMGSFRRGRDFAALAWPRPAPEVDGRQADPGKDLEDGTARHPQAADHGRHDRGARGAEDREDQGRVARPHAGAQAQAGRSHRVGQQDGPLDLGNAGEERGLSGSGGGSGLRAGAAGTLGM